jgi:hypothetical protein
VHRFSLALFVPPLFLVALADAGGEKQPIPEKIPAPKHEEVEFPRLTHVVATVEMKDGSTFLGRFRLDDTLTIRTENLGPVTLSIERVRFVDLQGEVQRVATHAPETFYGLLETDRFNVRMLVTGRNTTLLAIGMKRIVFPDRPREIVLPLAAP